MLIKLLLISLVAAGVSAGDIADIFPAGKTEKLSYDILVPEVNQTNSLDVVITRLKDADPVFTIYQKIDMPSQKIYIVSTEKYRGRNLALISSDNFIKLPPEAKSAHGTDSIAITAVRDKDSIMVSSNVPKIAPSGTISPENNFITSVGAMLASRTIDFKPGATRSYSFANLLIMTGSPYRAIETVDSVIGEETITVPAGEFDCFKVLSRIGQNTSITYFSKGQNHIPVKTVVYDPTGNKTALEIILKKID